MMHLTKQCVNYHWESHAGNIIIGDIDAELQSRLSSATREGHLLDSDNPSAHVMHG